MYVDRFRLDGKVAIVTGGGRGLGRQMALAMAKHGAKLVLAARTQGQLDDAVAEIRNAGGTAIAVPTDVTDRKACFELVDAAVAAFGRLDVMMNNAGIGDRRTGPQDLLHYEPSDWLYTFDVNLNGTFHCTQAAGRFLVEQGQGGVIVNTASAAAMGGQRNNGAYGAAKAAVIAFTKTTAVNLARDGIRANAIIPGVISQAPDRSRPERGRLIPAGRVGEATEMGSMAVFLASDASSYVTGEVFTIDGGIIPGRVAPNGFAPAVVI
jgi:2-deoxy-D-gluconate 3-dehydrogenase